jgi:tRNA-uridine 2-sulfurtransferase
MLSMQTETVSPMQAKKVVIGMSGGVDSSVAAALLLDAGYTVEAVFMQNWQPDHDDPYCSADVDLTDAKKVCDHLKIPLSVVNFATEYWHKVFQHMLDEFSAGRTPNPDVWCNQEIKFKKFLHYALDQLGADLIAAGHYAQNLHTESGYKLLKGADPNKDQTYFLYTLGQEQLKHVLFPVGGLTKKEVRNIAAKKGLPNFAKKDSTGICFIGERKFKAFLQQYLLAKPGKITTPAGEVIGEHDGLMFYTLGQRQGLKIGGRKDTPEGAWYVAAKDIETNRLVVVQDPNHSLLLSSTLFCKQLNWISGNEPSVDLKSGVPFTCKAKIRYRQQEQPCTVTLINKAPQLDKNTPLYKDTLLDKNTHRVDFATPQRAITPGQSVVFYQNDECLGGGIIDAEHN